MEQLSYSTAGQVGPTAVYAPPYVTATAPPPGHGGHPPTPPTASAPGVLPYGVEIPNRVFVGGCPFSMTDQQLGDFFSKYGNVKDSKIIADRGTGKSKGYGFVTFATEEEAAIVHAMGSIFYNEKKLNLARAIRKCGGQFNRANQEYVNGQRAVWMHPSGYLIQQFDGNWHVEQYNAHSQPVKPCYPFYYPPPPTAQHPPFYANSGTGFSPGHVNGTTFFPPRSHPPSSDPPPTDYGTDDQEAELEEEEGNEDAPVPKSPKDLTSSDNQLADQVKQLSLDSAYTSEADLERSTSPSTSPQEPPSQDCSGDDDDSVVQEEPPPDLNKIVEVRKSPRTAPKYLQKRPANLSHFYSSAPLSSLHTPPPAAGHYGNPGVYYHPAAYAPPPYMYSPSPYTPQAAIQTIGPVFHGNH